MLSTLQYCIVYDYIMSASSRGGGARFMHLEGSKIRVIKMKWGPGISPGRGLKGGEVPEQLKRFR